MCKFGSCQLLLIILAAGAISCGRKSFQDLYRGLDVDSAFRQGSVDGDKTLVSSGSLKIKRNGFSYALSLDRVYSGNDLKDMDPAVGRLLLKKAMLRKMALKQGMDDGIYATPEALQYLLPRLEKIMEDYYYYKKGDFEGITRETMRLDPGEAVMKEFYEKDKVLKKSGLKLKDLQGQKDAVLRVLAKKRMMDSRTKVMKELLEANPPVEVQ